MSTAALAEQIARLRVRAVTMAMGLEAPRTPPLPLREYVAQAWPIIEPATPFGRNWHIDAICDHLEAVTAGQIRNLLINMPPRHGKSSIVAVLWPTWEWTFRPETRWLFGSYAAQLSIRDSLKCRRVIASAWYQQAFGHVFQLTGDQNAKIRFENDRSGYRLATSVGGSNTGEGGDRIVIDDPHNAKEIHSDTKRTAVLTWWDETMSSRSNDPKTGSRVVVMQRLHEADLSGHILAQGGYEHLCLPAEYEGDTSATALGWSDPRTEPGELLWPSRFGPDELATLKRSMGSYAAAGQLQQRPAPAGGGVIRTGWFRRYQRPPARSAFDQILQSWDMTFKDKADNDYVCGQVWGRIGADKYLLERVKERLSFTATLEAVRAMSRRWPDAYEKLVEDKANGTAVIDTLLSEIGGMIPVEPEGGKLARAYAVQPDLEAGNVYIPDDDLPDYRWVDDFLAECAAFPNGAHDDQVDAMTQALLRLRQATWLIA